MNTPVTPGFTQAQLELVWRYLHQLAAAYGRELHVGMTFPLLVLDPVPLEPARELPPEAITVPVRRAVAEVKIFRRDGHDELIWEVSLDEEA